MSTRSNVLLIVMDQFRGDLLRGSALAQAVDLPHLRALMTAAVSFDQHFSATTPCGPSRVSLLTGQYAMNHRAVRNDTPLRHDTPNLALALRDLGYDPLLFGYTDTAQDPRVLAADDPRLDSYEELMPGFSEALRMRQESGDSAWRDHVARYGNPLPPFPATYRPAGPSIMDPALYAAEDSDTAFLTDQFLDQISVADPGWCATLTYIRPHPPLVAPAPYNRMYAPADMPAPQTTQDPRGDRNWHPFLGPAQDKQRPSGMVEGFPDLPDNAATTAQLRALYLALATEVDHHIGRIIAWLKDSGQWQDTILVVTADHGEMLGDYGLWGKGSFHDAAFHVPLILRDPGRPDMHGRRVTGMTSSIDVSATLLDLLGGRAPDAMNGQSLLRQLDDVTAPTSDLGMSEYDFGDPVTPTGWMQALNLPSRAANVAVLRTRTHRLVHFACNLPSILFDMSSTGERQDVSKEPEQMSKLLDLTQKMLCHRMINRDSTFAGTMIGKGGVRVGHA